MSFSVLCKRLEVMLVRDAGGMFGMTLRGGASGDPGKCRPLTVTQIRLGGPADRSAIAVSLTPNDAFTRRGPLYRPTG